MRYRWSRKPPSSFICWIFLTALLSVSLITTARAAWVAPWAASEERSTQRNELLSRVCNVVDVSIFILVIDQMMKNSAPLRSGRFITYAA